MTGIRNDPSWKPWVQSSPSNSYFDGREEKREDRGVSFFVQGWGGSEKWKVEGRCLLMLLAGFNGLGGNGEGRKVGETLKGDSYIFVVYLAAVLIEPILTVEIIVFLD